MEGGIRMFGCGICGKVLASKQSLLRHIKGVHQMITAKIIPSGTIRCREEGCTQSLPTVECLRTHLQDDHGYSFEMENHVFETEEEFLLWRNAFEEERDVSFCKTRGTKTVSGNKVDYYYCNRTGYFQSQCTGLRKPRETGKIGGHCTVTLTVVTSLEDKKITVYGCGTHYGHDTSTSIPCDIDVSALEQSPNEYMDDTESVSELNDFEEATDNDNAEIKNRTCAEVLSLLSMVETYTVGENEVLHQVHEKVKEAINLIQASSSDGVTSEALQVSFRASTKRRRTKKKVSLKRNSSMKQAAKVKMFSLNPEFSIDHSYSHSSE